MGVKNLSFYINKARIGKEVADLKGKNLVFDGYSLFYTLLRAVRRIFGGEYDLLYSTFKEFFESLKRADITPYVVLDGGSNIPWKIGTTCKRVTERIRGIKHYLKKRGHEKGSNIPKPNFTYMVFIEVMQDMQIKFVVAEREADLLVGYIANRVGGYAVSNDSDLFLMDIMTGIIPVDGIGNKISSPNPRSSYYHSSKLISHLNIPPSLLPFIAVFLGNDCSNQELLKKIRRKILTQRTCDKTKGEMEVFASYLKQFGCRQDVILDLTDGGNEAESCIKKEIETILLAYDLNEAETEFDKLYNILMDEAPIKEKHLKVLQDTSSNVETFLKNLVYVGLAYPCILDIYYFNTNLTAVQCEDITKEPSCEASDELRKYLYMVVLAQEEFEMTELKRVGLVYEQVTINISKSDCKLQPHGWLSSDNQLPKENFLFDLMGFSSHCCQRVERDSVVFLMSVRYWIQHSSNVLNIEYIQALVISYVRLRLSPPLSINSKTLNVDVAHQYCRWQEILFHLVLLNTLLRQPFPAPRFRWIYRGSMVHGIYDQLRNGRDPRNILLTDMEGVSERNKAESTFDLFMDVLYDKIESIPDEAESLASHLYLGTDDQ